MFGPGIKTLTVEALRAYGRQAMTINAYRDYLNELVRRGLELDANDMETQKRLLDELKRR